MPLDKDGRLHVVGSIPLPYPRAQTVDEMLEGWCNQQMCRNLGRDTIAGRIRLVEHFLHHQRESADGRRTGQLAGPGSGPAAGGEFGGGQLGRVADGGPAGDGLASTAVGAGPPGSFAGGSGVCASIQISVHVGG